MAISTFTQLLSSDDFWHLETPSFSLKNFLLMPWPAPSHWKCCGPNGKAGISQVLWSLQKSLNVVSQQNTRVSCKEIPRLGKLGSRCSLTWPLCVPSSNMPVWCGIHTIKKDINKLEKVQQGAARFALNQCKTTSSVKGMLVELKCPTLQDWRKAARLTMLQKITAVTEKK